MKLPAPESWLPLYEQGLRAAHEQGDRRGFAEIALFCAIRLDSDGRHGEAIAQLQLALSMAKDDPSAVALLASTRAVYEALAGNEVAARGALAAASAAGPSARPKRVQLDGAVNGEIARCLLLDAIRTPDILESLTADVQHTRFDWQLSGLLSWVIPLLIARGEVVHASPRNLLLSALADAVGHPWRQVDAATFAFAIENVNAVKAVRGPDAGKNFLAAWRNALLQLFMATRARDIDVRSASRAALTALEDRVHATFLDGSAVMEVIATRTSAPNEEVELAPPRMLTLGNLGLALAGIEEAAVRGTPSTAAQWFAWTARCMPREVRTSLEWPVSRDRVEGLLRVREGDLKAGVGLLRDAVRWCDEAGYSVEGAVARVQLAEVLALSDLPALERRWRRQRATGIETLSNLGVDPVPYAYDATRVLALGRGRRGVQLAPREVEVLRLLADGLTYREAAERVGVQWRTVQTHAYHAYSKLGVKRRVAAIDAARRLGII
jgi:DNA-binding CsgD family transcriptional regulator